MNKRAVRELYEDLPLLVEKGVLTAADAERLRQHYGLPDERREKNTLLLLFGVFGVLLVGLGIILLIAHNWEQFSRPRRLILCVGLLAAVQAAVGWVLWSRNESRTWREAAAAMHIAVIGAVIALIGQTYHLSNDTDRFILTWMLLSLPLVYLLQSGSAAVLYMAGVTYWATSVALLPERYLALALLVLTLPFLRQLLQTELSANRTAVVSWCGGICLVVCLGAIFSHSIYWLTLWQYSALFCLYYLVGSVWPAAARDIWHLPFKPIGTFGIIITSFIPSFYDYWHFNHASFNPSPNDIAVSAVLLLLCTAGSCRLIHAKKFIQLPFAVSPFVILCAVGMEVSIPGSSLPATIVNLYFALLSVWIIRSGIAAHSLTTMNMGMLLLVLLIGARFLDTHISFVVRGLAFVCLGAAFLAANYLMVRRKARG